ncbi:MAG: hypothetical protein LQ348_001764 [Seirophora lacunosa]|nr:MAG: hypothetical protein LQ348_001764 [Seirophora lacunosa]
MAYPSSAGGQPPSFKTNVNRAKTKRWVEAKSYTYDGDDWGEMDEYDEYGGYDEPPLPPKPTGLRQRGQSANQEQPGIYQPQQGGYNSPEASQHGYGELGRQGPGQQQYGARSATNPPHHPHLGRSGSFDRGDERRAFSASHPSQGIPPPQSGTNHPDPYGQPLDNAALTHPRGAQSHPSQRAFQPAADSYDHNLRHGEFYHPPGQNMSVPASDRTRQPNMGSRTQSMTSQSSMDFHTRRDFSPSAVPPPLHTRGSPSPHDKSESQSTMRPPRKSSLSQHTRPQHPQEDQNSGVIGQLDSEGIEPVTRSRTDSKPLPFVRPADIYKRLQEEKEKERQSQDSSRPSMDAITGDNQTGDGSINNAGGTSERSQAGDSRQRSRSAFDPVAERKGEYGTSGAPESDVNQFEEPTKQQATLFRPPKTFESDTLKTRPSPQLPDVARMSGFGELFAGPSHTPGRTTNPPVMRGEWSSQMPQYHPPETQLDSTLQHQPSLGFRSAVHQAFDSTNEPIPETPSSSNPDSSIGRSGSGGTGAVSPIISRGPSSATRNLNFRDPQIRPATPPPANQKADSEARPESSGSLATPKAVQRKPTPDLTDQRPASFIPGHRRDLSTPSPDNSPARTPAVEVNSQMQQPQEAELAMTTPIETRFPYDHSQSESSQSSQTSPVKASDGSDFATMHPSRTGRMLKEAADLSQGTSGETPKSPAESTRSRVRNLADKFESGRSSPAGSDRAPSPIKTGFLPNPSLAPSRPFASERMESFRPKLPGGWESSASLASLATHSKPDPTLVPVSLQQRLQNTAPATTKSTAPSSNNFSNTSDTYSKEASISPGTKNDASMSDPFASLAAAGSALAGAFSTVIGSDEGKKHSPATPTEQDGRRPDPMATDNASEMARPRKSSNTAFIPEASKPTMLATPDDGTSSIMPTPLDKMPQPAHSGESQAGDYFAAGPRGSTPKQQASSDSYTTQDSDSIQRSRLLPSISTEMSPQYESDRLRREIIRELSPGMPSESSTAESNVQSREISRQSTGLGERRDERESMVLPREYDSYWNVSGSEQSSRASSVRGHPKEVKVAIPQDQKDRTTLSPLPYTASQAPGVTQPAQNRLDERPGMPSHRFSWERTKEAVPLVKAPGSSQLQSGDDKSSDEPLHQPLEQMSKGINANTVPQTQRVPAPEPQLRDFASQPESIPRERSSEPEAMRYSSEQETAAGPGERKSSVTSEHPVHLDSPQSAVRDSESPVTQPNQYPYQSHQHRHPSQSTVPSQDTPPASTLPTAQPREQNFREILAMKNPQDRIKAYDESRQHFANIDSGLEHWLAATTTDLPEHKEILPHGKLLGPTDYKPSSTRSKLGGLLPSAGFSTQQPSSQQNPNANSPAGINAGQAPGGSPMQGYSPTSGGSKLTSQQMQARGKDLLHSAGVFGGKANVAAKGLFSKGKSRFRGGNADKRIWEAADMYYYDQNAMGKSSMSLGPIHAMLAHCHRQSLQQQHQSSESSPSTLQSASFLEQSSPTQSISSRPKSLVIPSRQDTQEKVLNGEQYQPHRSELPVEPASDRNTGPIRPIEESGQADVEASPYHVDPPLGDTAQTETLSTSINHSGRSGSPTLFGTHMDRRQEQYNQSKGIHSPHTPSSSNRTPTQADYADYFWRNSSPTAMRMEGGTSGNSQHAPGKDDIQQQSTFQPQQNDLHPAPILQPPEEEPLASVNRSSPNQGHFPIDPPRLQRGSEESDGTFRTAMSGQRRNSSIGANSSHRNTFSEPRGQPDEQLTKEAPYEVSYMRSPPTATSPAANIQDQPKERPFSFAQFSPSPALQPLENYSRREPSVDSTGSRIDPSQDVPPSPMSSGQSITHTQINQTDRNNPSHSDRPMFPSNTQDSASPEYRSLPQPHQEPTIQDHPAYRQEQAPDESDEPLGQHYPAPDESDEPLGQHYPAPVSRQDPVIPRSEATEFSLQGVGPPPTPRPRTNTSTSKRGSRSSAFFRSFKTPPTETSSPQLASENDVQDDSEKQVANKIRKSKSKRGSLFRSITGAKASSGEDKLGEANKVESSVSTRDDADRPVEVVENDDSPTKAPSKHRNRLSRTATPKVEEQQWEAPSKKKRFSAIGSLFGRSKDQKSSINRPKQSSQQMQPQDSGPRQGSSGHVSASVASGRANEPYDYTRDKLTREGFLAEAPGRKSSKPPETQVPAQQQHLFPPRQHSLGSGTQQSQQRPSGWSRESSIARSQQPPSQQNTAPVQHHRLHSSVTTRSTTHRSGISQPASKPQQLSSTTTTTTFTSRPPNQQRQQQRQQQQSNSFPRSDSPPPPAPPPKDTWHRSKQHQRSMSNDSFTQGAGRSSTDPPYPVNIPNGPPSTNNILSLREYTFPSHSPLPQQQPGHASAQPRQSLPPLQTSIPAPAPKPHDVDARQARRSQIETPTRAKEDHSNRYATTTTTTTTATAGGNGGKARAENDDEPVVMSATSFPGQMWQPQYGWDGRE